MSSTVAVPNRGAIGRHGKGKIYTTQGLIIAIAQLALTRTINKYGKGLVKCHLQ